MFNATIRHTRRMLMLRRVLALAVSAFLYAVAAADDARHLRAEVAELIHAGERTAIGPGRQGLLERAPDKLLEIHVGCSSAAANPTLSLEGQWVSLRPDDVLIRARLAGLEVGRLREVLGRELSTSAVGENGWTDLHLAALPHTALNLWELAEVLLDAGVEVTAKLESDPYPPNERLKRLLDELGLDSRVFSGKGREPIHIASFHDASEVMPLLLKHGADIQAADDDGATPLHMAARGNALGVAVVLIASGADTHAKDMFGRTPLHVAAEYNAPVLANTLIEHGADIDRMDGSGATPLHAAARKDAPEVVAILIERGAEILARGVRGRTPLHVAAGYDAPKAVATLVERGADIHARDRFGLTPLHVAARQNAPKAVAALIEYGADIHATDIDGLTPLHHTNRRYQSLEAAVALIERGADILARDIDGRTPLELAGEMFRTKLEAALGTQLPD